MRVIPLFVFAVMVGTVIHVLLMALFGALLGARIHCISLFFGPRLLATRLLGVNFVIRLLPFGGYVKFDQDDAEPDSDYVSEFQRLHPVKRISIASSGPLLQLLLAANLIGLNRCLTYFARTIPQLVVGSFMPLSSGQFLLQRLMVVSTTGTISELVGRLVIALAAFNLLPFPWLNGGYILLETIGVFVRIPAKIRERVSQFGFLVVLAIMCGWLIAVLYYITH